MDINVNEVFIQCHKYIVQLHSHSLAGNQDYDRSLVGMANASEQVLWAESDEDKDWTASGIWRLIYRLGMNPNQRLTLINIGMWISIKHVN